MVAISKIQPTKSDFFEIDFVQDKSLSLEERLANAIAQRTASSEHYKSWRNDKLLGKIDATSSIELQMVSAQYHVETANISATVKKFVDVFQTLVKG